MHANSSLPSRFFIPKIKINSAIFQPAHATLEIWWVVIKGGLFDLVGLQRFYSITL
jgi:hypothetical protein